MKQTAMQDLREDLILTQTSAKESLLEIENQETRKACQEVVMLILNIIIKRIDDELLEMEKEQIIEAYDEAEGKIIGRGEQYYNEQFKNK